MSFFSFLFFFLNTLVLLLPVLFDVFSLWIFIFFLESKKECIFLPYFVLTFPVRVYVTMKCCFWFNKYFFAHDIKRDINTYGMGTLCTAVSGHSFVYSFRVS